MFSGMGCALISGARQPSPLFPQVVPLQLSAHPKFVHKFPAQPTALVDVAARLEVHP